MHIFVAFGTLSFHLIYLVKESKEREDVEVASIIVRSVFHVLALVNMELTNCNTIM